MRWLLFALSVTLLVVGGSMLICAVEAPAAQAAAPTAKGEDRIFEGPWRTTNRRLDGIMTCVLKDLGDDKWQGRFYGVWQGVPFDYTVKFVGSPAQFKGTAVIDHADYVWSGSIDDSSVFKGSFGGSRYTGFFELNEKRKTPPAGRTAAKPRATVER